MASEMEQIVTSEDEGTRDSFPAVFLQIVDSSLAKLDWGLDKLKEILTSCWMWRRRSTQEQMD
jgi:hypothetical protein